MLLTELMAVVGAVATGFLLGVLARVLLHGGSVTLTVRRLF